MRLLLQVTILSALMVGVSSAQGPAFVNQLPGGGAAPLPSQGKGGAFVQQLPADVRVRPATTQPAAVVYVKKDYVVPKAAASAQADPVVYEDVGVEPYGEVKRPALPSVAAGTTVILRTPNATLVLPSIGAGAVLL